MDLKTIKNELWSIARSYPTLAGLMMKQLPNGGGTVGGSWAAVMHSSNLDGDHFENVCFEYANFEKELPQPADQLAFEIISEVKHRKWKDDSKLLQMQKYHATAKKAPWRDREKSTDRFFIAMGLAMDQKTDLTDTQLDDLTKWANHNGAEPEWLKDGAMA